MSPAKLVLTMSSRPSQFDSRQWRRPCRPAVCRRAEYAAGVDGDVLEGAVLLVLVEGAGRGVVGDVDVGPAVVVEVGDQDAETVGADGLQAMPDASETSVKVPSPLLW